MNPVAHTLREAAKLVKAGWCQAAYALNATGGPVDESSKDAVRFCTVGAIHRAVGSPLSELAGEARNTFRVIFSVESIHVWNDDPNRTQAEVVAALEKAAELAEGENK